MMYRAVALCALVLLVVAPSYTCADDANMKSIGANTAIKSAAASAPASNASKPPAAPLAAKGNDVATLPKAQTPSVTPLTSSNPAPGAPSKSAQPAAAKTAAVEGQQQPSTPVQQNKPAGASVMTSSTSKQQHQTAQVQQVSPTVAPAPTAETLGLEVDGLMSSNTQGVVTTADDHSNDSKYDGDEWYIKHRMPHSGKAAKKTYKYGGHYDLAHDAYHGSAASNKAVTSGDVEGTLQSKQERLQKYFVGDQAEVTSEIEQDSEVSSFALPAGRYSSKAAKYAAAALKTQAGKQAAGGRALVTPRTKQLAQPVKQQGLAGLTAAWLKNKHPIEESVQPATLTDAPYGQYAQQDSPEAVDREGQQYARALDDGESLEEFYYRSILGDEQYLREGMKKHGKYAAQPPRGYVMSHRYYGDDDGGGDGDGRDGWYDNYDSRYGYDDGPDGDRRLRGDDDDGAVGDRRPRGTKEPKSMYNFRAKKGFIVQNVGATVRDGKPIGPVQIEYQAVLTCGASDREAGTCRVTGSLLNVNETTAHVYITCELMEDVSKTCGLKYLPGMQLTSQGIAEVKLTATKDSIETMRGRVLPITGAYTPSQKDTLLGDVLAVLHGVKGGSLNFNTEKVEAGNFNFFMYK